MSSTVGTEKNVAIDLDNENEVEVDRTSKRLYWTHDEEVKLVISFPSLYVTNSLLRKVLTLFFGHIIGKCLVEAFQRPNRWQLQEE